MTAPERFRERSPIHFVDRIRGLLEALGEVALLAGEAAARAALGVDERATAFAAGDIAIPAARREVVDREVDDRLLVEEAVVAP